MYDFCNVALSYQQCMMHYVMRRVKAQCRKDNLQWEDQSGLTIHQDNLVSNENSRKVYWDHYSHIILCNLIFM